MPDILKWVSKDNLITFWNEIRESLAGVVAEEVNEILGPTVEPMIDAAKDAVLGNLSTVESSSQASQNYSKGDYLVLNKNFYKVTDAITSGDTLEESTNIEQTTVGEEMRELISKNVIEIESSISSSQTGSAIVVNIPSDSYVISARAKSTDIIVIPIRTCNNTLWVKCLNWDMSPYTGSLDIISYCLICT